MKTVYATVTIIWDIALTVEDNVTEDDVREQIKDIYAQDHNLELDGDEIVIVKEELL